MSAAEFVVVANRLPVDRVVGLDGEEEWRDVARRTRRGTRADDAQRARRVGRMARSAGCRARPLRDRRHRPRARSRSAQHEVADYYEGFANDTIWPLYHDVIAPPQYHREWWDAYVTVNRRFAEAAAAVAAPNGTVWVHDYQLQLVPQMVRELRPDVTIGYFHHIPFPAHGLYAQLPWRDQVLRGLLGADVIGFQRAQDATYFLTAVRRRLRHEVKGSHVAVPDDRRRHAHRRWRRRSRSRSTPRRTSSSPRAPTCGLARPRSARASATPRTHPARRRPARLHQGHPAPHQGLRGAARRRAA